jgi:UDP-MurNAc hydroxylase
MFDMGIYKNLSFKFITNACGVFQGKLGTKILCDPWLIDGVFDGSWCHYPKISTTYDDVKDVDAIYISHLHPDHFDERYFNFDKSTPLIVLDHGPNFLIKKLSSLGYNNLIKIKNEETIDYNEFKLTMFAPFSKHNFHNSEIGNLLDSALLISCDGISALNTNDNILSIDASKNIQKKFGQITFAMLNYNAAGPYPSCFDNLTDKEKTLECNRLRERNLSHLKQVIDVLKPRFILPFAGSYVIGGSLNYKNKHLATLTWDECSDWLHKNVISPTKVILLRENDVFYIDDGLSSKDYKSIDLEEMQRYINDDLSKIKYPYQFEDMPDRDQLITDIEKASSMMIQRMNKYSIKSKFKVILNVYDTMYQIYPCFQHLKSISNDDFKLICKLDLRLLRNIIDRKSHWNNVEVGAHISFNRSPNLYEPDLHTGLQFFHI